jgi:murein L,D-transpeptidase YcbB/YkuD
MAAEHAAAQGTPAPPPAAPPPAAEQSTTTAPSAPPQFTNQQSGPPQPSTSQPSVEQPSAAQAAASQSTPAPTVPADPCADVTQDALCAFVESGHLADLRWPNFNDYRKDVKDFYVASSYALAWSAQDQPTPQARAIISALQDADKKGLRADDYDGPRWSDRLARLSGSTPAPSADDWARFDLELTVSAMRYISDLHNGRISPQYFEYGLDIEAKKYKLAEFLRTSVVSAPDMAPVLEEIEPAHVAYRRAMSALAQYVALAKAGDGEPLPALTMDKIKPGDVYPGLPQLAQRLKLLGDLPPDASAPAATGPATPETTPAPTNVYDGDMVKAVKHFQQRHGLLPDGTIDKDTFDELGVPLSRRVTQLQLLLERWRWLPSDLHPPMIVVNIPEFQLHAYGEKSTLSMKTVVGKALDHQTPVFADTMRYVIFRPYWNVPKSIVEDELLPAITRNRQYLDKHHYEVVDREGEIIPEDKIDAKVLRQLKAKKLEIRQKPGPGNALGAVKFVFPNHYDVYLHGTPERKLFSQSRRDFSHGCIRVEDPAALAAWVLRGNHEWTRDRIRDAMDDDEPLQVNLPRAVPVLILYGTASVEENGEVHFFADVYGHDAQLERALAGGLPYPTQNPVANSAPSPSAAPN